MYTISAEKVIEEPSGMPLARITIDIPYEMIDLIENYTHIDKGEYTRTIGDEVYTLTKRVFEEKQ